MKKKAILAIIAIAIIVTVGAGSTLAYLVAMSPLVSNTFVVGKVNITLTETTGNSYKMTPGATVAKDPQVTVKSGSEDCWLFVKVDGSAELDSYISYELSDGWYPLSGYAGVYYRQVDETTADTSYQILENDSFTVKSSVDKSTLASITSAPKLTFTAYAIQALGIDTPVDAWSELQSSITGVTVNEDKY